MLNRITRTASFLADRVGEISGGRDFKPEVGIILGTGLGGLTNAMDVVCAVPYGEIPDFPVSTVKGHSGRLVFGMLGGKRVVAMQGRMHYYEGYTPAEVVFPVRVMGQLGISTLMVSNAAGGVNRSFEVGDIMVITDHINLIPNPLVGKNIDELGPRFPDMHDCYDPGLREIAARVARENDIKLREGVYVGTTGPTYETQAEYRYFEIIGGDAVAMSTTPEVIAARHMGVRVFGVSVITDVGLSGTPVSHEEVQKAGAQAGERMTKLFTGVVERL